MSSGKIILIAASGALSVLGLAYVFRSRDIRNRVVSIASSVVPYNREHAVHKEVSQGRAFAKGYSGCGDLWNYVLDKIGAPNDYVNRDNPNRIVTNSKTGKTGPMKWGVAVNISKPWGAATRDGARVSWKPGLLPKAGDLMLIGDESRGEMAHVFVVLSTPKAVGAEFKTAEYGGASNAGNLGTRTIDAQGLTGKPGWRRHVVGWIDVDKIPKKKVT